MRKTHSNCLSLKKYPTDINRSCRNNRTMMFWFSPVQQYHRFPRTQAGHPRRPQLKIIIKLIKKTFKKWTHGCWLRICDCETLISTLNDPHYVDFNCLLNVFFACNFYKTFFFSRRNCVLLWNRVMLHARIIVIINP